VLFVVADDVVAGEAIMRSEVVDGCPGPSEPPVKEIGGAGHARGQLRPHAGLPPPETPHRIAKAIIPFGEARGMIAQLVTVRANIPGFRDQLEPRQHRVPPNGVKKAGARVVARAFASERAAESAAECAD